MKSDTISEIEALVESVCAPALFQHSDERSSSHTRTGFRSALVAELERVLLSVRAASNLMIEAPHRGAPDAVHAQRIQALSSWAATLGRSLAMDINGEGLS
jgi:hypothetical protein